MKAFQSNTSGQMALLFAIVSVPVMGAVGIAIDYSRALNVRAFVQAETDQAALAGARLGPGADTSEVVDYVRASAAQRYGEGWIAGIEVAGTWETPTDFRVKASGRVPVTLLAAVPGFASAVDISVDATARAADPKMVYTAPEVAELDPEAGDYNRISVYCFDEATGTRSQKTRIADNGGTRYQFEMPRCEAGQAMSYQLTNVRNARTSRHLWDNPAAERYDYFSDTVMVAGVETYDFQGWELLETVLCDRREDCRPRSQGGIIPEGRGRTPQRAERSCQPGKYMYYGFEDRPPGNGWTDRDYDDIRIIISCPKIEAVGDRTVRLIE